MEEQIVSLLKENGRVIIPDFGAFIVKTKSPFKVIFNEFLQYNDGALISSTAKKLGIERDQAATKVKDYSTNLISELDKGNTVTLPEIGNLSKSSTGKITLGDSDSNAEDHSNNTTKAKEEETASSVEFDLSESKPKAQPTPKPSAKPKAATPQPPPTAPAPKVEKIPEVKEEKVVPPVSEPAKQDIDKEPSPIAEYYEEEPSRNKLNLVLWIILIVLVNGALIGYFIFDEEIKSLFNKDKSAEIETFIDTPSITDEEELVPITDESATPIEEEPFIENSIEEIPEPTSHTAEISGKKYYVVAGVFKEESNADNLVTTLTQQGYNAEKFGKIGSMYAVSFDVFPTKKEADQFMMKMKKEVDAETWIKVVN